MNNVSIGGLFSFLCFLPYFLIHFMMAFYVIKIVCRLSTVLQFFILLIQWKPLNRITLGQRQAYSNNQLMIIREFDSIKTCYERVLSFGTCQSKWIWSHHLIDAISLIPLYNHFYSLELLKKTKKSDSISLTVLVIHWTM